MSNAVDLEQLIKAVRRQPGAPAYALLAERYIEFDDLSKAIEICRDGFAANPAYERGAVAYLRALRGTGDAHTAARIYGRAIAEHPRSSRLRVAWAQVLADAGRMAEARLRAREAADLDPMSRDARSLLASVGGTPPPALRNTGGIEALGDWPSVVATPTPEGLPATGGDPTDSSSPHSPNPAQLDPLAQEAPAHALFDFTPGPSMMPSISPAHTDPPALDELADLYEVDLVEEPEHEGTATDVDSPPPPAPPPPPPGVLDARAEPAATARPEMRPRAGTSSLEFPTVGSAAAREAPLAAKARPDDEPPPLPRRRLLLWVGLPLVVLLATAALGLLTYRIVRQARFERATAQIRLALKKTITDDPAAYRSALQSLAALADERPSDGRVAAARGLVAAHLVLRFGSDKPSPEQLTRLLHEAGRLAPRNGWTIVALAMHQMRHESDSDPMSLLDRAPATTRDWHFRLAKGTALTLAGRIPEAASSLQEAAQSTKAAAVAEAAARLARLRGIPATAQSLIAAGLGDAPQHAGLMLQRALLDADLGRPPSAVRIAAISARTGEVPRYRGSILLLQARLAHRDGELENAISLAETAAAAHPASAIQAGWLGARWRLPPGGDVGEALAAFRDNGSPLLRYRPGAAIWHAQALVLQGRPHDALELLRAANTEASSLTPSERLHLDELLVHISHAAADLARLRVLCPPSLDANGGRERVLAACTEVHLRRGRLADARRWIKRLGKRSTPLARYLRALAAEAEGDGARAYNLLKGLMPAPQLDHAALLLAQARAYMTHNDMASSIATLREARRVEGNSTRSRVALASALVAAAHDTEATTIIGEVLTDGPTDPAVLSEVGASLVALGRLADASRVAKAADSACPQSPVGPLLAGHVALLQSRLDTAQKAFVEVLKRHPNNAEALIQLGQIAAKRRRKRLARRRFAAALRQRPKDAHLLYLLAQAHAQTGSYKSAHDYGQRAIRLFQDGEQPGRATEVMVNLGRQLARGDRYARERGRELLFQASVSSTPPATAFLELGRVYKRDKDLSRALWCFRRATQKDPLLAAAQLEFGRLLYRRGKRKTARTPLKRFLELAPQSPEAPRVKALLARKR